MFGMVEDKIVVSDDVLGGEPRISGSRVRVVDVVGFYEARDLSPEEISDKFGLTLEDVYAALVYYYENPKSIRSSLSKEVVA